MKRLSVALLFLVLGVWPANAQQNAQVIGPITVGDCAIWNSNTILKDAGFSCSGGSGGVITGTGTANFIPIFTSPNVIGNGVYMPPAGSANLYASASGSDTNNKCTASGTPCTLKGACTVKSQLATFLNGAINIALADGTYSSADANSALCTNGGNGGNGPILTILTGNCTTPANVVLAVPDNSLGINNTDGGELVLKCVTITGGNGSTGISGGQYTITDIDTVHYGAFTSNGVHVALGKNAIYNITGGGEFYDGNVAFHWQLRQNAALSGAGGTTLGANVTDTDFLDTRGAVYVDLSAWTLTAAGHTVTGQRANLIGPGYMLTAAAASCNTAIPGSSNCAITLGFQDNANDAQTSAPPLATSTFGNLPTPVAGMYAYITNGLAGSCGDGTCTTWGTTVTGGGGALKLFIWYNGANWTLAGK
jgi:hypothetical protein